MSAFAPADNVPRGRDLSGAGSEWSDGSNAPSVHLTPATQVPNPFELTSPPQVSQPATTQAATTTAQWQPGQSVPADFAAYDREFKELKMRPGHTQNLAAGAQTLRRIKSNNVMNGIASGRIQKNSCSSAQRSPLNFSFAEAANRSPYRRASAFAGMPSSASLAPPTPLSPSEYPRAESQRAWPPWQNQGHVSRQPSISESESESVSQFLASNNASNNNFGSSPPTTPLYPSNLMRSRLGSMVINENTPPQSAPATQQSFSNTSFAQHQAQIQQPAQSVPVLQSQSQTMVPAMPNEYPQMPNVVFPMQQFQVPVSGPFMEMPMPYAAQAPMMVNTANMPMNYGAMPFMQSPMSAQPGGGPNMPQYPFVPSSTPGQNVLVSASVPKQQAPSGSDLFIHEYSPPQSIKQSATPRRTADSNSGPKSYQFANSGPEHYEKGKAKQEQQASSPSSSAGGSTASS
ncbi:hypothetical protein H2203_004131 [Taxawa tesnikishii (nom. ined.)]|nr:hypothetical protein H2203_004131 [Dothideales sp. JES 119]